MQKIVQYTTQNDGYKKNGTLHVKGIMLHSTATPGILAKEFRDRFDKPGLGKSVHGFIDDVCYVQCLPYDKKAGHCRYSGNDTHIGIELCEPKEWRTDAAYFAKVYANAVQVFSELCREFSLSEADILDHAEGYRRGIASNHSDVGHWFPLFGKSMDTFRADVGVALRQGASAAKAGRAGVLDLQRALNKAYAAGLVEDGLFGKRTKAAAQAHLLRYRPERAWTRGAYVPWVQERLQNRGYALGSSGVDGIYGKRTAEAVRQFQKEGKLQADGIVGPKTARALCN